MTEEQKLPPSGKLGVFIDVEKSPPVVTGFSSESGAEKAGLEEGDKIIRIADKEITSYYDLRIALMDKLVDETVSVEVTRDSLLFDNENHTYEVILK